MTNNSCNLRCPTCPNYAALTAVPPKSSAEFPFEKFTEIASQLFPTALEYHASVAGEPLLTSYFHEIPDALSQYGVRMNLTTNGMLLDSELSKSLMPILSELKISFDSPEKSTFERLRPGSNFETILENVKQAVLAKHQYLKNKPQNTSGLPRITLQATLMRENIEQLPDLVRLARNLGVDRLKAYLFIAYRQSEIGKSLWFHQDLTDRSLAISTELANKLGLQVTFPRPFSVKHEELSSDSKASCHFLWQEAWINQDGNVIPCCNLGAPVLGNVFHQDFLQIWNNAKYMKLRRDLITNKPAKCCQSCALVNEFRKNGSAYTRQSLIQIK